MPTLNWIGKEQIINHHNEVEYNIIECIENIGEENSGNLLVKGDNLLALKSLLPYYAGEVKMIYIDPPYNTGNTSWVYNDATDAPIIKKWLNKVVDKEDLSKSDKWLCMMHPRLKLLNKFLKKEGVIFISIDDAEVTNLTNLCNEIFGSKNFVTKFIWQKKKGGGNDSKYIAIEHEYILMYAKNKDSLDGLIESYTDEYAKRYKEEDSDGRYYWDTFKRKSGKQYYPITCPDGSVLEFDEMGNKLSWLRSESRFYKDLKIGDVKIEKMKHGWTVFFKQRMPEGKTPRSLLLDKGTTSSGSSLLLEMFGKNIFDNPKPVELIQYFIDMSTNDDDIILDSFAGSGTTAHAVLAQNKKDNSDRKFILIEMEQYARDTTFARLKKAIKGYTFTGKDTTELFRKKLTMSQLLKPDMIKKLSEKMLKTIDDEQDEYDTVTKILKDNTLIITGENEVQEFKEGIGGGFQYCELSEPLFDELGLLNESITHKMLSKHLYFCEFGQALSGDIAENTYLGEVNNVALYVFTNKVLKKADLNKIVEEKHTECVIYADRTTISDDELKKHNIAFKQLPFSVKDK